MLKLKAIIVRDLSGELFAQSSDDGSNRYTGCPLGLKSIAGTLVRLLKPSYSLCSFDGQLYSEVLMPVGALEPRAYLDVVAYAAEGLRDVEQDIGMPLKIVHGSGSSLYLSDAWADENEDNHLLPRYKLYRDEAFLTATISAYYDLRPVIDRLTKT